MILAGSRSLSSAEHRYAPVEGEALAVAWGLEQTKYDDDDDDLFASTRSRTTSTKEYT